MMASTTLKEPPAVGASRRWAVDPRRSTVEFRVPTFWGLSTVAGHFDHFEGPYRSDGDDVPAVDLTIDADSLDTGNETRAKHLRAERFFNVAEYPQVRFSSTLIHKRDRTLAMNGQLEAAGGSVPVALDATVREEGNELEIEATTTVDQRQTADSPREPSRTYEYTRTRARKQIACNLAAVGAPRTLACDRSAWRAPQPRWE
jgi:polyisoprenoid-binding protein YceI